MPVVEQYRIYRLDCEANPDAIYVFGDNMERRGLGGQAKEMRGEPNAIGVATKVSPNDHSAAYFYDDNYAVNVRVIANDFRPIFAARDQGKIVILPLDGLGTGFSQLPEKAPLTNQFVEFMVHLLKTGGTPAWKQLLNGQTLNG